MHSKLQTKTLGMKPSILATIVTNHRPKDCYATINTHFSRHFPERISQYISAYSKLCVCHRCVMHSHYVFPLCHYSDLLWHIHYACHAVFWRPKSQLFARIFRHLSHDDGCTSHYGSAAKKIQHAHDSYDRYASLWSCIRCHGIGAGSLAALYLRRCHWNWSAKPHLFSRANAHRKLVLQTSRIFYRSVLCFYRHRRCYF